MGDLLKINGTENTGKLTEDSAPEIEFGKIQDNTIVAAARKHDSDGFEYQYRKAGTEMWQLLVMTGEPETVLELPLSVSGVPEKFEIRAVYIKKLKRFGVWSATYNITVG